MTGPLAFAYRLAVGLALGAQVFFAAVAAQAAFPRAVAALPQGHPDRNAAATLVGLMLASLDRMTLVLTALAVVAAVVLGRQGGARAAKAAIPPAIAGLCAVLSTALITPAIQAMRAAGTTHTPEFGKLHAGSSLLLLFEIVLLAAAMWMAPRPAPDERRPAA